MTTIDVPPTKHVGQSLRRKEDPRLITGQGSYVDDISLPGQLWAAWVRSPEAHAKITSIDTSRALAHPNVAAVITAKDLETLGLAWMPTISYDTQAVLAFDRGHDCSFMFAAAQRTALTMF